MIRRELKDELTANISHLSVAADELAHHTSMFIRGELLPAARDIAGKAVTDGGFANADAAKAAAKSVAEQRRQTIAIPGTDKEDEQAWTDFLADLKVLSAPHISAGASSWPEHGS